MDAIGVSDFSIDRILTPQLAPNKAPPDLPPPRDPAEFHPDTGHRRPPAVAIPIPVPVPVLVHDYRPYPGMSYGEAFGPYGADVHPAAYSSVYPRPSLYTHLIPGTGLQPLGGYRGYHSARTPQAHRQRPRMRTVFTDEQVKQLEALFERTNYPPVETRAELAYHTGLTEESVRVWFKNRRARSKRQAHGSKVPEP